MSLHFLEEPMNTHDARASRDAAHANIEKLHIALSAMRDLLEDAASVIDGMNGRCQTTTEWISRADAIESSVSASPKKE